MLEHPECEIVFTGYENFTESDISPEEDWVKRCCQFASRDHSCLPTALFRRSVVDRCGCFSDQLVRGEDTEWIRRIRLLGVKSGYLDRSLYLRRLHGLNLTRDGDADGEEGRWELLKYVIKESVLNAIHMRKVEKGISVLIPARNAQKFIVPCIDSIRAQNFSRMPVEIIVVDDGSDDCTGELAREAGAFVFRAPPHGTSFARNNALALARYSYIFFLDADDRIIPGTFDTLAELLEVNPSHMAAFSRARDFYDSDDCTEKISSKSYSGCLPGCSLIRREVFCEVGLFDCSLKTGETVEWLIWFRNSKLPAIQTDAITLERRVHQNNTGVVLRQQEQLDYARIIRDLLGREARQCPDPTLLLTGEQWRGMVSKASESVVVYMTEFDKVLYEVGKQRAEALGIPLVCISTMISTQGMISCAGGCGPAEWLSCIDHAREVYTNSFHGVVFSTLFHKELFVKPLQRLAKRNSRLDSFLNGLDAIRESDPNSAISHVIFKNGWADADTRAAVLRAEGMDYLRSVLSA